MDTKADMDGTMVELLGGIETIRTLDSAQTESLRIEGQSEQLRKKEMRHHKAMALYDCLKFVNEAFFSVLVIGISVLLASQGVITIGTVLTAYLCFTQLTGPLRELHRILDEFSEGVVLANDYFQLLELPLDFSYADVPTPAAVPSGNDVQLHGVRFAYPEKPDQPILQNIDLSIAPGKFIGIAGPSGCGKSTLIKIIDKLEQAEGDVALGGAPPGCHVPPGSGTKRGAGPPDPIFDCRYHLSQHLLRVIRRDSSCGCAAGRPQGQYRRRH